MTTTRLGFLWKRRASLRSGALAAAAAGLLMALVTPPAAASHGPAGRTLASWNAGIRVHLPVGHAHLSPYRRGYADGSRDGWCAGYEAGRSGCAYAPRAELKLPRECDRRYAHGYRDGYARGYRAGYLQGRRDRYPVCFPW